MSTVPEIRIVQCNTSQIRRERAYVLYWMTAQRRTRWNFALQRALEWAQQLDCPIIIFEALRLDYRWANDRHHRFALQGMYDNQQRCQAANITYYPYVELLPQQGKGLLEALSKQAAIVITDDYPAFFIPPMVAAAASRLDVRLEKVDSNGLLPIHATERVFLTAFSFRAFLQKELPHHLDSLPFAEPLLGHTIKPATIPASILKQWPVASEALLQGSTEALARLNIDHHVKPSPIVGGSVRAEQQLSWFISNALSRYADERNHPDNDVSSGLSPWLHWGHLSSHEIFHTIASQENWSLDKLGIKTGGKRTGWWNLSPEAESFLDELVTWRELGFNMASLRPDYHHYASLPAWAKDTLSKHKLDPRPKRYDLTTLEAAQTYDPLWNAAQTQLVREGRIHNYMRMLWGKKVFEWSSSPEQAFEILEELNNKYALDGRDPNSYSGILWIFGRYDRPWGPERSIFGQIRYMSSENTAKKLKLKNYLQRYA